MNEDAIDVARGIAQRAHEGQEDKVGAPYIEHPAMVADLVQRLPGYQGADPLTQQDAVVAAWLHDVVEDSRRPPRTSWRLGSPGGPPKRSWH